jgi:hypothetical protein
MAAAWCMAAAAWCMAAAAFPVAHRRLAAHHGRHMHMGGGSSACPLAPSGIRALWIIRMDAAYHYGAPIVESHQLRWALLQVGPGVESESIREIYIIVVPCKRRVRERMMNSPLALLALCLAVLPMLAMGVTVPLKPLSEMSQDEQMAIMAAACTGQSTNTVCDPVGAPSPKYRMRPSPPGTHMTPTLSLPAPVWLQEVLHQVRWVRGAHVPGAGAQDVRQG